MKTKIVSEAALDTMETMVLKLQQENDMLLAVAKRVKYASSYRAAVYCSGESQKFEFANQQMWNAIDDMSAAIAKVEQVQPVFERMGLEQPEFPGIRK